MMSRYYTFLQAYSVKKKRNARMFPNAIKLEYPMSHSEVNTSNLGKYYDNG